ATTTWRRTTITTFGCCTSTAGRSGTEEQSPTLSRKREFQPAVCHETKTSTTNRQEASHPASSFAQTLLSICLPRCTINTRTEQPCAAISSTITTFRCLPAATDGRSHGAGRPYRAVTSPANTTSEWNWTRNNSSRTGSPQCLPSIQSRRTTSTSSPSTEREPAFNTRHSTASPATSSAFGSTQPTREPVSGHDGCIFATTAATPSATVTKTSFHARAYTSTTLRATEP
ncbi:hypothetical protein LTR33_017598, partial [Friedmanniomyces endolithicus]